MQNETTDRRETQKLIASFLDRQAMMSSNPASGKQCWFLAGLLATQEAEDADGACIWDYANQYKLHSLSKGQASQLIDELLNKWNIKIN